MSSAIIGPWIACIWLAVGSAGTFAQAPWVDPAQDQNNLGTQAASLFWTPQQQVSGYRNWGKIFPTRTIAAGDCPGETVQIS